MKKILLAAALTAGLITPGLLNQEPAKETAERYTVSDVGKYTVWIEALDESGTYSAKAVDLNRFPTDPYEGQEVLYFPASGRVDLEEFYSPDELTYTGEYVEFE